MKWSWPGIVYSEKLTEKKVCSFDSRSICMRLNSTLTVTISNLSTVARVGIANETGVVIVDITRSCNPYLKHESWSNRLFSPKYRSRLSMHILRKKLKKWAKECYEYTYIDILKTIWSLPLSNLILAAFPMAKRKTIILFVQLHLQWPCSFLPGG